MSISSIGRTLILVLALFAVLAGINMLGRMATPVAKKANPTLGAALDFVF